MRWRGIAATVGVVALLGVVAAFAGPQWRPKPNADDVHPLSPNTDIGGNVQTPPPGTYEVITRDQEIQLDGITVDSRLYVPVGAAPGRPGLVLLHGAGTAGKENFAEQAQEVASAGVYVLVPSKRMDTYDGRNRDYIASAEDYGKSFDYLSSLPEVDPTQVFIFGESEGASIAAVLATVRPVAGVVLVAAPIHSLREQAGFAVNNYLRNTHVPRPVFRLIPRLLGGSVPGGGLEYIDFDPRPYMARITAPTFVVYGTADQAMPVVQGVRDTRELLRSNGNEQLTVRYYPKGDHGIKDHGVIIDGYLRDLARWINGGADTASAQPWVAGDNPHQEILVEPIPSNGWYSGNNLILVSVAPFALLAVGGLVWVGSRLAGRGQLPRPVGRRTLVAALAPVVTLGGLVWYAKNLADLALNYRTNDVIAVGGWYTLQVAGVATAAAFVASVLARQSEPGQELDKAAEVVWWTLHVGAAGAMFVTAYWGVPSA